MVILFLFIWLISVLIYLIIFAFSISNNKLFTKLDENYLWWIPLINLLSIYYINKGINMNFKNNTIDNALSKKKQVEELEQKLIKEKETMNQMKNIAKKDLEWILND